MESVRKSGTITYAKRLAFLMKCTNKPSNVLTKRRSTIKPEKSEQCPMGPARSWGSYERAYSTESRIRTTSKPSRELKTDARHIRALRRMPQFARLTSKRDYQWIFSLTRYWCTGDNGCEYYVKRSHQLGGNMQYCLDLQETCQPNFNNLFCFRKFRNINYSPSFMFTLVLFLISLRNNAILPEATSKNIFAVNIYALWAVF